MVPRSTSSILAVSEALCQAEVEGLTLQEQGQERNHEYQEDTDDAAINPGEHGAQVVAARRTEELS